MEHLKARILTALDELVDELEERQEYLSPCDLPSSKKRVEELLKLINEVQEVLCQMKEEQ